MSGKYCKYFLFIPLYISNSVNCEGKLRERKIHIENRLTELIA